MTSKEIGQYFDSSTRGVRSGGKKKGFVTFEMMERATIIRTIKKTRKGLPSAIIAGPNHILRKFNPVSE